MKKLDPEDEELVKRIRDAQVQQRAKNPLRRKNVEMEEDIGMVSSFFETKLLKSELLLHEAARKNSVDIVKRLVAARVNVDCRNRLDRTPLQWAAATGGLASVKVLLESGADIEAQDKYGMSALLWAAWFGHVPALDFILTCGADPYTVNKQGLNILHCAVTQNNLDVLRYILDNMSGYDINLGDRRGQSALHLACKEAHVEAFDKLMERTTNLENKDKQGRRALHVASDHGDSEVVEKLLRAGADIDARDDQGMTALHLAAERGHSDVAHVILSFRPEEDSPVQERSLVISTRASMYDGCEAGTANGTGPVNNDPQPEIEEIQTPASTSNNRTDADKAKGAFGRWFRRSKIETPPEESDDDELDSDEKKTKATLVDVVQRLLEERQAIGKQKPFSFKDLASDAERKMTALHMAASAGHVQTVRVLLQNGCDPNVRNAQGDTPLHLAAVHEHRAIIGELAERGANINLTNNRLYSPLHLAVERGSSDSVEELLIHGADTSLIEKTGKTPLQMAARASLLQIVDMIIKADLNTEKIRHFPPVSNSSPKSRRRIDEDYRRFMDSDPKAVIKDAGPHVYRSIMHPQADVLKTVFYKISHQKMSRSDWRKLAKHWQFGDNHINAIQHQFTGEHSHREHGYRVMLIWLHGLDPKSCPMKELHQSLVAIGRKSMAESARRELQSGCGSSSAKNCVTS